MNDPEIIPGVLLFFKREKDGIAEYAFQLRKGKFHNGLYCPPGGHNEGLETYEDCALREASEELGVTVKKEDLTPVHLLYRKGNSRGKTDGCAIRPDMCFVVEKWQGEFRNLEPEKHGDIEWFSSKNLPENIVDYVEQALENIKAGIFYSNHGF